MSPNTTGSSPPDMRSTLISSSMYSLYSRCRRWGGTARSSVVAGAGVDVGRGGTGVAVEVGNAVSVGVGVSVTVGVGVSTGSGVGVACRCCRRSSYKRDAGRFDIYHDRPDQVFNGKHDIMAPGVNSR